jgi:hypothetical protein
MGGRTLLLGGATAVLVTGTAVAMSRAGAGAAVVSNVAARAVTAQSTTLRLGSRGPGVRALQQRLVNLGYLPTGAADGVPSGCGPGAPSSPSRGGSGSSATASCVLARARRWPPPLAPGISRLARLYPDAARRSTVRLCRHAPARAGRHPLAVDRDRFRELAHLGLGTSPDGTCGQVPMPPRTSRQKLATARGGAR